MLFAVVDIYILCFKTTRYIVDPTAAVRDHLRALGSKKHPRVKNRVGAPLLTLGVI